MTPRNKRLHSNGVCDFFDCYFHGESPCAAGLVSGMCSIKGWTSKAFTFDHRKHREAPGTMVNNFSRVLNS